MSYNTTCNVNVLKVVDLRLKTDNNIPPGLNSTLFTGPQNVYGSPLTWDYILTSADLSTLILQQSSIISTNTYYLDLEASFVEQHLLLPFSFAMTLHMKLSLQLVH